MIFWSQNRRLPFEIAASVLLIEGLSAGISPPGPHFVVPGLLLPFSSVMNGWLHIHESKSLRINSMSSYFSPLNTGATILPAHSVLCGDDSRQWSWKEWQRESQGPCRKDVMTERQIFLPDFCTLWAEPGGWFSLKLEVLCNASMVPALPLMPWLFSLTCRLKKAVKGIGASKSLAWHFSQ